MLDEAMVVPLPLPSRMLRTPEVENAEPSFLETRNVTLLLELLIDVISSRSTDDEAPPESVPAVVQVRSEV